METNWNHQPSMMIQTWHGQHPSATSWSKKSSLVSCCWIAWHQARQNLCRWVCACCVAKKGNKKKGKETRLPGRKKCQPWAHACVLKTTRPIQKQWRAQRNGKRCARYWRSCWSAINRCFPKRPGSNIASSKTSWALVWPQFPGVTAMQNKHVLGARLQTYAS